MAIDQYIPTTVIQAQPVSLTTAVLLLLLLVTAAVAVIVRRAMFDWSTSLGVSHQSIVYTITQRQHTAHNHAQCHIHIQSKQLLSSSN